jgi:hypothetical protein
MPKKRRRGARLSAGIVAITDAYAIGLQYLTLARRTRLENERKEEKIQRTCRLDIFRLKEKDDMVLAKGETPEVGTWNKTELQWFKREGDKAMPKNKEDIILQ